MISDEINAIQDNDLLKSLLSKAHRETAQAEYECLLANRRLDIAINKNIELKKSLEEAHREIEHLSVRIITNETSRGYEIFEPDEDGDIQINIDEGRAIYLNETDLEMILALFKKPAD